MAASKSTPIPVPKPETLHHCSRRFGILHSVQQDEDCQIACIGKRRIVLPQSLDMQEYIGKYIGIVQIDGQHYVQEFCPSEASE